MTTVWAFIKNIFRRKLLLAIILIALIAGGYFAYQKYFVATSQVTYQTAQAEKGTLVSSVTASGTISAGNSLNITTQASGIIKNVYVKNGDSVTQGQKIADMNLDLDSQQRQAAAWTSYSSSLTSLKNAQNSLRTDQASLEKTLDDIHLFQYGNGGFSNVGSANETETQKASRTSAQVAVDKDNDALNQAQIAVTSSWLSYEQASSIITAPSAGLVNNLIITPGLQITGASNSTSSILSSQKLGSIALQKGQIQTTASLSEVDIPKIKPDQKATLTLSAFPDKTFTGKVLAIDTSGAVSSGVTTYPATISIDSAPDNIYPNMAVTAKIITNVKDNVLLVPSAAIQSSGGQSTVKVMRNNQPESVNVETGDSNDTQTEITSGLNEGDTVVTGSTSSGTTSGGTATSPFSRTFGGGGGAARFGR